MRMIRRGICTGGEGFWVHARPYVAGAALLALSAQGTVSQLYEHAQLRAGLRLGEDDFYIRSVRGTYQAAFFPGKDAFENRFQQQTGAFQLVSLEFAAAARATDPDVTGSIAPAGSQAGEGPARTYPVVNRANKGDRLVRRDGTRLVLRADPRTGRMTKVALKVERPVRPGLRPSVDAPSGRVASVPLPPNVTKLVETVALATGDDAEKKVSELSEARNRQLMCLAKAVYFEARGEPERGQLAVAQVVMNRVSHPLYPDNICDVVFQNEQWRNRCQFSFACDGRSDRPRNKTAWERAIAVAKKVMNGKEYLAAVGKSTHYHANYVRPRWIRDMIRQDRIGKHIFYRVRGLS